LFTVFNTEIQRRYALGQGRPDGLDTGFFVKPAAFANVTNHMTIAREDRLAAGASAMRSTFRSGWRQPAFASGADGDGT